MSDAVVRVPPELVAPLDAQARAELRSRSNMAARLVAEGLARREQDDSKMEAS